MKSRPRAILSLAALATGLIAFYLLRYPVRGFRVPMGPDSPVYMWWANLAKIVGLSVANWRPGMPALTLTVGGTLGLSQLEVIAGLGAAFAAAIGLGSAALLRGPDRPLWTSILAGALAGAFAVHLAGGYFGNIVFAAIFLAALVLLSTEQGEATSVVAVVLLLGAGGLTHPLFLLIGIIVLLCAVPFLPSGRRRVVWLSAAGGAAVTGVGMATMLLGQAPLRVDTSADSFFRRAGFAAELKGELFDRLGHHWVRYVPIVLLPLAWFGRKIAASTQRAFLASWAWVCLGGLAASFVVQTIPGVRMIAFAYALPILAGLGLWRLAGQLPNRKVAALVTAVLAFAMLWGAALTWFRERPYTTPDTVQQIRSAGVVADELPPGTPLIFVVDEPSEDLVAFRVTNAGNLIRAYMPAERIADVRVYVGRIDNFLADEPTLDGSPKHDALSTTYLDDLHASGVTAQRETGHVFVLDAFNPPGAELPIDAIAGADLPSPWSIVVSGVLVFALLWTVGFGWARAVTRDNIIATALAPALGAAALILVGVVADRIGLRLSGPTPLAVTALAGLGGFVFAWRNRLEGDPATDPPSQVDQ